MVGIAGNSYKMKPEWGLGTYFITKADNGYVIWCNSGPSLDRAYRMKVVNNLRTAFIWLAREFGDSVLLSDLEGLLSDRGNKK